MFNKITSMNVLYSYLTSDHFVLSTRLDNVINEIPPDLCNDSDDTFNIKRVHWDRLTCDTLSKYTDLTDLLLHDPDFVCDAVCCSGGENCSEQHKQDLILLYENLTKAMKRAGEMTFPESAKSNFSYATIAIATVMSKILKICVQMKLEYHLWTTDNQFAYKTGHSTDMCVFILKEIVRHYNKHRAPMYVWFLDASKAFDCVNHWKLFKVMVERKCSAFIIKLLIYWCRNQKLCVKWDSVISNKFSMSNDIKQGGILSPKLFNIYFKSFSKSLNEKHLGCCLTDIVVNHLYYADDLVLVSPSASGMNELIQECESFSTEYGLKFNESKTVLLYFKPYNFKINPCTSIKMNGTLINVECSCKYLGHLITSKLSDNEDMKRQIRSFMAKLICYHAPSVNAHTM